MNARRFTRRGAWVPLWAGAAAVVVTASSALAGVAQISPGFPVPDYSGPHLATLYYTYSELVQLDSGIGNSDARSGTLQTVAQTAHQALGLQPQPLSVSEDIGAPYNATNAALATTYASVGGGAAHVYADVQTKVGLSEAQAEVIVELLDVITVDNSGLPDFGLTMHGSTMGQVYDSLDAAGGTASLQFYVWRESEGVPAAGTAFHPAFFQEIYDNNGQQTTWQATDDTQQYTPGSKWFICARMDASAGAQSKGNPLIGNSDLHDVEATVDYSHTAYVRITADPTTPGFSYTSDSGFDYTSPIPTPEPASLGLVVAGLVWVGRRPRGIVRRRATK